MNICQVIISKGWGGAEAVVYETTKHLTNKGHNVSIILNQEEVGNYADLKDVKIHNIGYLYNLVALTKSIISALKSSSLPLG